MRMGVANSYGDEKRGDRIIIAFFVDHCMHNTLSMVTSIRSPRPQLLGTVIAIIYQ